jgi:biotin carboxyl carrier protein
MTEILHLIVEGEPYVVEVDDLTSSPLIVRVNGRPFVVEVVADKAAAAASRSSPGATDVTLSLAVSSGVSGVREVTAPMPGNILDIAVKSGDRVAYRQLLCSLEAMKMKNALRSPREGTIAAVHVHEGQTVAYGDPLFTFK